MTKTNYTGYLDESLLPIQAGQTVKLPKGTLYNYRGDLLETQRTRSVKVDHVLPGQSCNVGTFYHNSGDVRFGFQSREDMYKIQHLYGTNNLEALWPLMTVLDHGHYSTVFLPVSNPQVSWAGSGGYWCRADINQFDF